MKLSLTSKKLSQRNNLWSLKRVVVTGLGAITPLGNDVPSTWAALLEGVSGAGPITLFDASEFKTQFACQVKDFDPLKYFNAKEVRKLDRYTQFALAAAQEGIADSGLDLETVNKDRAGVIFSAGIGGISTFEQEVGNYAVAPEKGPRFNPFFIPKMIADIAAGQISMIYGFRGPNFGIVSACASSTHALIDAYNYIRLGKADFIVSGGAEGCDHRIGCRRIQCHARTLHKKRFAGNSVTSVQRFARRIRYGRRKCLPHS